MIFRVTKESNKIAALTVIKRYAFSTLLFTSSSLLILIFHAYLHCFLNHIIFSLLYFITGHRSLPLHATLIESGFLVSSFWQIFCASRHSRLVSALNFVWRNAISTTKHMLLIYLDASKFRFN